MLINASELVGGRALGADVVIVGGGTLGLYLASEFSDRGKSVVVVESGGMAIDTASNSESAYGIGKPHNGILHGRGQGLGGTSALWGGQLAELEESDLARDGVGWPISFPELRHWYAEAYRRLRVSNPPVAELLIRNESRYDKSGVKRFAVERFFTAWLPEPNFARLYKNKLTGQSGIKVILGAKVNDIRFVDERAVGVSGRTQQGCQIEVEGQEIVIACGTLEANRLMLYLQAVGAPPWRQNEHIGLRFQDHIGGRVAGVRLYDEHKFRNMFENRFLRSTKLQPKLRWTQVARACQPVGISGMFSFDSDLGESFANLKGLIRSVRNGLEFRAIRHAPADLIRLSRVFLPIVSHYVRERRIFALFNRGLDFHVQSEQIPIYKSKITLAGRNVIADGMPPISLDWQIDGSELVAIREFAMTTDRALRGAGVAELSIDPRLAVLDPEFMDGLSDTYHACGGLCMSATPRTGVVDIDCRVWGTKNLFVAGSAVFPTSGHANSTFTALALASRLASNLCS